jgi:hypothetical protein
MDKLVQALVVNPTKDVAKAQKIFEVRSRIFRLASR